MTARQHIRFASLFTFFLLLATIGESATTWTTYGPAAKVIKAVSISPEDSSVMFAGSFGWGVFKSTNSGATWTVSKLGLTNGYVRSIAALSNTLVFCGTNDGVFKSTDGGVSWLFVLPTAFSVRALAYDAQSSNLYAGTFGSGLYRSGNLGNTWTPINVTDVVVGQTLLHLWSVVLFGRDSLYVGGSIPDVTTGGALFRSLDGGTSWEQIQRATHIGSSVHAIAIDPLAPTTGIIIGTATKGVYRSTNAGLSWSNISDTGQANTLPDFQINTVAFNTNYRYAGTDSLGGFYSRSPVDGTTGWTAGSGLPGAPSMVSSIVINTVNRSTLFLGTEGDGVYRSGDAGFTWSARNSGMLRIAAREVRRNGNGDILLGTDFGDGIWKSTDHGITWIQSRSLPTANSITAIATTTSPTLLYAAAYGAGVYKSTDGGTSWTITDSTVINHFVRTLEAVPSTNDHLFAGTGNGVFASVNGGSSWQASNTGIPANTSIRSMAIDPVNPVNIYVGTDSLFMYKSTNSGGSWAHITNANGFLAQDIFIRTITIDPASPAKVYAGTDSGRIYRSTNSGSSWSLFSQLGATHSVRSILLHPTDRKFLFAATFGDGIFESADSGAHWQSINTGLTDLDVYTLEYEPSTPLRLFAGSSDFGVYQSLFDARDHKPVIGLIGAQSVLAGQFLSFTVTATDSDATIPSLFATGLPSGASFTDSLNGKGRFTWTPTMGQLGDHTVMIHATDGTLSDSEQVMIHVLDPSFSSVIPYSAWAGWNLVSIPVRVGDARKGALFPAGTSQAFAYTGSYSFRDTLDNGEGFWIKFPSPYEGMYSGATIGTDTVNVRTSWNLIGSVSAIVARGNIVPLPPAFALSQLYGYEASKGYVIADSVKPGRGYWLKMGQGGQLVLGRSPNSSTAESASWTKTSAGKEDFVGTLTMTNHRGDERALYILSPQASDEIEAYALPPKPPEGGFDIRFASSQGMAIPLREGNRDYPLEFSGEEQTYTLRWSLKREDLSLRLQIGSDGGTDRYVMIKEGSVTLQIPPGNPGVTLSTLTGTRADIAEPSEISLSQNFPNPFNPATTIEFALPSPALVRLVIYDALGREVTKLMDGNQPAGRFRVRWDASGMSSGVYFLRLEASYPSDHGRDQRITKKMFLLR